MIDPVGAAAPQPMRVRDRVAPVGTFRRSALRFVRRLWWKVTLRSARRNARMYWPDARGVDLWSAAIALLLLRYHDPALAFVCRNAHRVRRFRPAHARLQDGPRRVLHVTCSFDLGGTQTQIRNLCVQPAGSFVHDAIETFPEMNYLFRHDVTIDPARFVRANVLVRTAGRFTVNVNTRSAQLFQIYKLVKDFRTAAPEIVVGWGHEMCMLTFVAAAIARVPRIVFCIRTFNPAAYEWTSPFMRRLLGISHRRMQPFLDKVIVNSTVLQRDHAAWLGISPDVIAVCANGIDIPALGPAEAASPRRSIRRQYGIPEDALVLINVGRFSSEKGQMSVVKANRELLARCSGRPFFWMLCGDGPTQAEVEAYAAAHGMTNVVFPGRTDNVRAFLCAADVFVMPSDFEGMPNAMMEAMAQGLACVSTNRSGALDIARNGLEALYYDPGDIDTLVRHLTFLMEHADAREAMGRLAQARMNEFSVTRSRETFDGICAELRTPCAASSV